MPPPVATGTQPLLQAITPLLPAWIGVLVPYGIIVVLVGFIFYLFILAVNNDEKLDRWIARIAQFLIWIGVSGDKSYIEHDIRGRLNSASKKMNREAEGVVSKQIEIRWVNQENIESFLRKGKVIILMKHHQNQDKNIVNAALHYTQKGVLHTGKRYLPEPIRKALDLSVTKKILSEEKDIGTALEYFTENVVKQDLIIPEVNDAYSTFQKMEETGLFSRIFLREIKLLGKKLYPQEPKPNVVDEGRRFVEFLKPFAFHQGKIDNINEWEFIHTNIKVGIMYVAKQGRLDKDGLTPYINGIERRLERGCQEVYVFARGIEKIKAVQFVVEAVKNTKPDVKVRFEKFNHYSGVSNSVVPCVCAVLTLR